MVMATANRRISKPKTRRGKKFLENRESKIHENPKCSLFVKGGRTSEIVTQCLKDLYQLKKPEAVMMKRKNPFQPFEDETTIEKFSMKYDASLFVFGSHSKKRPNNLVVGRLYDYHILDMVEFGMENYIPIEEFKVSKITVGAKPCLTFSGPEFESDETYKRIKNLFIDFFGGEAPGKITLEGICYTISFTVVEGKICLRVYRISLKKSGTRVPYVHTEEMGPRLDLKVRRHKLASMDLFKLSLKQPKEAKIQQKKNISHDVFGSKLAQIHVGKQNINKVQTRKMKGLRKSGYEAEENPAKKRRVEDDGEEMVEQD